MKGAKLWEHSGPMRESAKTWLENSGRRLDWLGPVRMLVVAFIAFGYASTMPRGPGEAEYLRLFGYDPSWYGISLIFMISGFLALRSLGHHGSALRFLLSRAGRNMTALAIFAALVIAALYPLFGAPAQGAAGWEQHAVYFLRVVSCFDPNTLTPGLLDGALYDCIIQGGLWTFRWGAIAYVCTALVWAIGGLQNRQIILAAFAAALALSAVLIVRAIDHPSEPLAFAITGLRLAWPFLLGMCAYAYRAHLPRRLIVPLALITAAAVQFYFLPWTPFIEICTTVAMGYLVFLICTSVRPAPKAVAALPDLSLGLYIFNWPAAQITLLLLPALTPLGLFAIAFPAAVLAALVLHFILGFVFGPRPAHMSRVAKTAH